MGNGRLKTGAGEKGLPMVHSRLRPPSASPSFCVGNFPFDPGPSYQRSSIRIRRSIGGPPREWRENETSEGVESTYYDKEFLPFLYRLD